MQKVQKRKKEKQNIVKMSQIEYIKNVISKSTYVPKGKERMKNLFMGIDTGTQGVRVGIVNEEGVVLASCEKKWDTLFPQLKWAEQDPIKWWDNIKSAIEDCLKQLSAEQRDWIISCAVCATASTAVPVKIDGTPLANAIMWMDARSQGEMELINQTQNPALHYCGGQVSFEWLIPKVLWIKKNEPEIYKNAYRIVEQLDWINFQLSGVWTASKCNATCKGNYCDVQGGFSDDFFKTIGFSDYREKIITDIKKPGEPIGKIRPELAERFGLNPGLVVVQGGVDAHIALLGMNAFAPGQMGIIMGTSFVHLSQVEQDPGDIKGIWGPYINPLIDGTWLLEGGQITASGLVNWFINNFHTPVDQSGNPYSCLSKAALTVPPGSQGLTVLDFFQGNRTPYKDANARGVIYGLNINHSWKHIYRALIVGVSFGTRNIVENQVKQGFDVNFIVGCGGVTKDKVWMQIISDILGKTIAVNEEEQAGVMGCCLLAASGGRCYKTIKEAADAMVRFKEKYEPDMKIHQEYEKPYQRYLRLYQNLKKQMSDDQEE